MRQPAQPVPTAPVPGWILRRYAKSNKVDARPAGANPDPPTDTDPPARKSLTTGLAPGDVAIEPGLRG